MPVTKSKRRIASPSAAWAIALGGTAVGVGLTLWEEPIRAATLSFFDALGQLDLRKPALGPLVFWVGTLIWATLLAMRLQVEDVTTDQRTLDLIRAILRAPNVLVVRHYPTYYRRAVAAARGFQLAQPPTTASEAAERIRALLTVVADMAKSFANAEDASYGANVMLVADRGQFHLIAPKLRFIQSPNDVWALSAIVYLPEALLVSHVSSGKPRHIPLIALPVAEMEVTPEGFRLAIPGAPTALLGGAPSIFFDTRTLHEECTHLAAGVRDSIQEYFEPTGDGKDIRSFASYRIGREAQTPIGVLNIDSSSICVLGPEEQYYPTFTAMLEPILAILGPLVLAYTELAGPQLLTGPTDEGDPAPSLPPFGRPPAPTPVDPAGGNV